MGKELGQKVVLPLQVLSQRMTVPSSASRMRQGRRLLLRKASRSSLHRPSASARLRPSGGGLRAQMGLQKARRLLLPGSPYRQLEGALFGMEFSCSVGCCSFWVKWR